MRRMIDLLDAVLRCGFTQEHPYLSERRTQVIEQLGTRWILHPDHRIARKSA